MLGDEPVFTPHHKDRSTARCSFLKTANRQKDKFAAKTLEQNIGDTVDIRAKEIERKNTDDKLLPCKVLEITVKKWSKMYKLWSHAGGIKQLFSIGELVDMCNVHFAAKSNLDPTLLDEITIIQASGRNSNWQITIVRNMHFCKGSCINNRSCCKKAGLFNKVPHLELNEELYTGVRLWS